MSISFKEKIKSYLDKFNGNVNEAAENALKDACQGLTIELRPYQQRACLKTITNFLSGAESILIESPTGSGKTIMGLTVCRALSLSLGVKIGWSAMRRNLLTQAENEASEKNFGLDLALISMFDKNPPSDVDLLVVDEAHHDATSSMSTIHGIIKPSMILGLSATPLRTDKMSLSFKKTIREAGIYELVREKVLASAEHYTIKKWTPEEVTRVYLKNPSHWGKTVMFFTREEECLAAKEFLEKAGVASEVVTGKTDRYAQLDRFESGEVSVLLNMNILTEGFDCPSLETAFVRPSVRGLTMQMCGRVLRKFEKLQKKVVQCADTEYPFSAIAPVKLSFILSKNGRWVALNPTDKLKSDIDETIKKLAEAKKNYDYSALNEIKKMAAKEKRRFGRDDMRNAG